MNRMTEVPNQTTLVDVLWQEISDKMFGREEMKTDRASELLLDVRGLWERKQEICAKLPQYGELSKHSEAVTSLIIFAHGLCARLQALVPNDETVDELDNEFNRCIEDGEIETASIVVDKLWCVYAFSRFGLPVEKDQWNTLLQMLSRDDQRDA